MGFFVIYIVHTNFTVCSCIYRIGSDRTLGKYEYGTLLQLYFDIFIYIPYIIRGKCRLDIGIVNINMGTTKQLCIQYGYKYGIRK